MRKLTKLKVSELRKVTVLIICCCVFTHKANASFTNNSFADSVLVDSVSFFTANSLSLTGTIYLPHHSPVKKIIVYMGRPDDILPAFDFVNNTDSVAFLRKLVDNLIRTDVGLFFLPMRVPYNGEKRMEIIMSPEYNAQNFETLVEDTKAACVAIRQDARFKDVPVGVMGPSAMGRPAAMAAAQNKNISFVVALSTPSTDSFDDAEYSYARRDINYMYLRGIFSELWKMVNDTAFVYNGKRYASSDSKLIEDQFIECSWDCFKKINRTIIAKYSDYNTIQKKATDLMKSSFKWEKEGNWIALRGENAKNPDEFIDSIMRAWHKPIDISFLRWDPEEWYPQLVCPTLFLFAENDKIIDLEGSLSNVDRIKKQYKKSNFTIDVVKGCRHSFDYYYYIQNEKGETTRRQAISEKPFRRLSEWLNDVSLCAPIK